MNLQITYLCSRSTCDIFWLANHYHISKPFEITVCIWHHTAAALHSISTTSRLAFESQIVWSDITKASKAVWVKGQKQKFHQLTGTTFLIYIYTRRCSSILSYHIKLLSKSEDIILCSFLEGRKKPDDGHMAYTSISISIAYLYYNWLWKFHGHLPKSKWHLSHA